MVGMIGWEGKVQISGSEPERTAFPFRGFVSGRTNIDVVP